MTEELDHPTAVHALCDAHDTPFRPALDRPAGSRVGWIDHLAPSQCATTLCAAALCPTARQSVDEEHDTALKLASLAPIGLGAR